VSDTAEYGDYVSGPRIINGAVRPEMKKVLTEIQDGTFAAAWIAETEAGQPNFKKMRERGRDHQIEKCRRLAPRQDAFPQPVEVVDGQPQAAAKNKG